MSPNHVKCIDVLPMIIFAHIEKTGGTTLNGILRTYHGMHYAHVRALHHAAAPNERAVHADDLKLYRRLAPGLDCVSGHAVRPWVLRDEGLQDCLYMTVLREPIARYVSYYTYGGGVQRKPWPYTFEDYLDQEEFKNYQVKRIAGVADADVALDIIKESFMATAVLECMDKLLENLDRVWPGILADAKRVGRRNERTDTRRQALLDDYQEEITANNAEDIKLYNFLNENFDGLYLQDGIFNKLPDVSDKPELRSGGKRYANEMISAIIRRAYLEPVTGLVRLMHGLPFKGTY